MPDRRPAKPVPEGRMITAEDRAEVTRRTLAATNSPTKPETDRRFTFGLIYDVVKVLETYGYVLADDNAAMAKTSFALYELVQTFEGRS